MGEIDYAYVLRLYRRLGKKKFVYAEEMRNTGVELTPEEELRCARTAGTIIGKSCIGLALLLKGAGIIIDKGTGMTAEGLRLAADGIETAGKGTAGFLYEKSDVVKQKGNDLKAEKQEVNKKQEEINRLMSELGDVLREAQGNKMSIDPEMLLAFMGIKVPDKAA